MIMRSNKTTKTITITDSAAAMALTLDLARQAIYTRMDSAKGIEFETLDSHLTIILDAIATIDGGDLFC